MNLKVQVIAINKFLSDIYHRQDMRLSYLLAELDFDCEDIRIIRQKLMSNVIGIFLNVSEKKIVDFHDGVRKFKIIEDIYGLNGSPSMTLRQIGTELNISHERVRQIKQKVIRKLAFKNINLSWKSEFKQEVKQLVESYHDCAKLKTQNSNHSEKYNFHLSSLPNGEKVLTISEGNSKIIICESNFQEFYDNFMSNSRLLVWDDFDIYDINNSRKKYSRAYEKWTTEEEQWLKNYLTEGLNIEEIAELLERQPGGISSRINKLDLDE